MSAVADVYARLRSETAKLLGFDVAALSPAQDVRVSMVAGLRLEFDRLQTAQLRGEAIDPKALVVISEQLESALRPAEVAERPGSSEAHRKLRELLEGRHRATEAEWARESEIESEVAADYYRDLARPPAAASAPAPAAPAAAEPRLRVVRNEAPSLLVPVPPPQPSSSEREWASWYYAGGGNGRQPGWDSPPKGW